MSKDKFSFSLLKENSHARLGKIYTSRGEIDTPSFMTVGTQGTIKSVFIDDVIKTGAQIILSNTYHLMIRPGVERIKRVGGLHEFMNCTLPILTDSGGFQIMSLSKLVKIDEKNGAIFNSHIDGKYRAVVRRAMDWLASRQQDDGNLGWTTFYEQGIAAMAICEDVALTPYDNRYRNVAAKAVGHILTKMGKGGGFGYHGPGTDTSITGWAIMAIKSAYIAKIYPQFPRVKSVLEYLNRSYNPNGSTGYQGRARPNNAMTAVGMFCRIFLNYKKNHPEIIKPASLIIKHGPNVNDEYYTYYATYCMFQIGGKAWKDWNNGFRDPLIALQEKTGKNRGSWGRGKHGSGGRVYFTAINIMSLEVYQRYLPAYW